MPTGGPAPPRLSRCPLWLPPARTCVKVPPLAGASPSSQAGPLVGTRPSLGSQLQLAERRGSPPPCPLRWAGAAALDRPDATGGGRARAATPSPRVSLVGEMAATAWHSSRGQRLPDARGRCELRRVINTTELLMVAKQLLVWHREVSVQRSLPPQP